MAYLLFEKEEEMKIVLCIAGYLLVGILTDIWATYMSVNIDEFNYSSFSTEGSRNGFCCVMLWPIWIAGVILVSFARFWDKYHDWLWKKFMDIRKKK